MLARTALSLLVLAATAAAQPATAPQSGQQGSLPKAPTEATFEAWREHILPVEAEITWESIPWLPTFADGMRAADAAAKPLLLWVMNGHPLGCT